MRIDNHNTELQINYHNFLQKGFNPIFTLASLHILLLGGLSATEMAIFQLNVKLAFPLFIVPQIEFRLVNELFCSAQKVEKIKFNFLTASFQIRICEYTETAAHFFCKSSKGLLFLCHNLHEVAQNSNKEKKMFNILLTHRVYIFQTVVIILHAK